jgi:hypothetical protein
MGIARSWVDWKGGDELDMVEPQHGQIIANPRFEFGWSVSCALGCTTSAESDGNERK